MKRRGRACQLQAHIRQQRDKEDRIIRRILEYIARDLGVIDNDFNDSSSSDALIRDWAEKMFGVNKIESTRQWILMMYHVNRYFDSRLSSNCSSNNHTTVNKRRKTKQRSSAIKKKASQKRTEYAKYIKSYKWASIRECVLARDDYRCLVCGSSHNLHVHHKTYAFFKDEMAHLEELMTVCESCHDKIHGRVNGVNTIKH